MVVGNAPAEDYDLPKAYNRHLGEHYGYLISRGVPCVDPSTMTNQVFYHDQFHMIECYQSLKWGVAVYSGIATSAFRTFQVMQYKDEIEPLTILNAGEGEGDLHLMEFMFRYPTISEVRAAADLMLAGRRAVDQIELSPADIVDAVDQEIMNWLLQEEETDVVRLKDTSHVLAQEMAPDDLLRLPIDAEELDESEHDERHRIIMKELYPDLPTPMGGQELVEEFPWEVPDEGDTLDFDEWERALEEKKKNPDASSFIPPVEVPLPPPKTEEEKADDEAFADVRTEKSYVIVEHPEEEQPDWDDDDADSAVFKSAGGSETGETDKPEPMEVDEKAQGEQKKADEEAAPGGQNDVDQPAEESQGGEAKETPGQASEEKTQTDDAQPMEIDLTGEDDAEKGKPKKKPSATKPQKPSVPEGSPKPELTELEKVAAEAKAHYEELSYIDEKTGRIVVKGEQEERDARFKKWKEAERLAIRPKAQPKQVRRPNLEPTLRAIDTEDPSKDLEFAQLPGQEVWLGPEHLRQIPRRDVEWGRFRWISQELTSHLRGHKELKGFDTPDFEEDGSKPWKPLMECLQKRINQRREWEVLLVIKNSEDERFELKTRLPGNTVGATWKGLPYEPVGIKAVQGHNRWVTDRLGHANFIKRVYSLDPDYVPKMVDEGKLPRMNMVPDLEYLSSLPRVLYHSCDRAAMEGIITSGLIPGGFPKKTGRAHNYFTTCPPWKAQMRKLAGTRAGQPIYLAFDTELVMQHGCRVFATRKSILCLDWVPNSALMYAYDARNNQFVWFNRAYAKMRQMYHEEMKSHSTDDPQFRLSKLAEARNYMLNNARQNQQHVKVGQINLMRGAVKMTGITDEVALTQSQASREGPPPELTGFMLGQVCIIINEEMSGWAGKGKSKGKSKGKKGKGKGKFRDITDEDLMANEIVQIPKRVCPSPLCATKHFDGQRKCDYCRQDLQVWSDARSASELARMEETANLNESVVALDQLSTRSFRKANVVKDTSKGEQQRGAKSAFGLVKRLAVNYVRKAKQLGLPGPTKRLEVDPLFAYNCATTQLTSGSLTFLHRLARAIFANPGRSALERKRALDDQEREHHSKLCFIPTIARDPNDAMSIEDESFVCHHNRFFNLKQFSMWCSLARTRNEPVVAVEGWGSLECVPEGDAVQILSDLVEFAERNWARACEGTEYSDTTIFSGRFPEVKLTERRSTAKESTKTAFDPRSKGVGKDAKLCYECGSPDHRARDCPEAKGRNKGKGKGKGKSQYQGGWQSSWNQGWGGSWGSGSWDWNRSGRSSWQSEAASSSSSDWWSSSKGGWWNR